MEINRVTAKEYQQLFPSPISAFNSVAFSELNKDKCVELHYLTFKDSRLRLGIIIGEKSDCLRVPFSASYGGFSFNSKVDIRYYDEACQSLAAYVKSIGKPLYITMAPTFYDTIDNSKTLSAFVRIGATIQSVEYNQHFELKLFENYETLLDSKVRNKLRNALSCNLLFNKLDSKKPDDVARVYSVIQANHIEKGRPLRMSLRNVLDTIKIISADFFIVEDGNGHDVAAAQIFHTTPKIYQIVYWGDIPEYSYLKPMNFLAYKIFEYYYAKGIEILDIGISTEDGIPNYGLCEFKENIGCVATSRITLKI